jgi:hypothetical protein
LPKWKKDAKEFTVSVNFNEARGYQSSIPKPIIDVLGDPRKVKFVIDGKNIRIVPMDDDTIFKEKKKMR